MMRFTIFATLAYGLCVMQSHADPLPADSVREVTLMPKKVVGPSFHSEALLRIQPTTVSIGEMFIVDCQLRCTMGCADVYNPFLSSRHILPAQILITSADGLLRHNLVPRPGVTHDNSDFNSWVLLRSFQAIGRELTCRVTASHEIAGIDSLTTCSVSLPPGDYFVQAVYDHWIIPFRLNDPARGADNSTDGGGDEPRPIPGFTEAAMKMPLAISDPVKFRVNAKQNIAFAPQMHAKNPLHIDINLANSRTMAGRNVTSQIRFVNRSDKPLEIFNPFLDPWLLYLNRSLVVALLSEDGKYIGDLLSRDDGSYSGPTYKHWSKVPPGGYTSTDFSFLAGCVPQTKFVLHNELPPGRYFLELRGHHHLTSGRPFGLDAELQTSGLLNRLRIPIPVDERREPEQRSFVDWLNTFPGPEILRSNRVELEILPRTGD